MGLVALAITSWGDVAAIVAVAGVVTTMFKFIYDLHHRQNRHENECTLRYEALKTLVGNAAQVSALHLENIAVKLEAHADAVDASNAERSQRLTRIEQRLDRIVGPERRHEIREE